MPIDWLTLGAAALTGLMGGVHCAAMCGGIATGFSAMSARGGWIAALEPNLGRVLGYTLAGVIAGAFGHGILDLARADWLVIGLRAAVGLVLIVAALRLLDRRGRLGFLSRPGAGLCAVVAGSTVMPHTESTTAPAVASTVFEAQHEAPVDAAAGD